MAGWKAQLQNRIYLLARIPFNLSKFHQYSKGSAREGLFANRISACAQSEAAMRIMQIVGRTNRHIINALTRGGAVYEWRSKRSNSTKKLASGKPAIHHANRVIGVKRNAQSPFTALIARMWRGAI